MFCGMGKLLWQTDHGYMACIPCIMDTCIMDTFIMDTCITLWIHASCIHASWIHSSWINASQYGYWTSSKVIILHQFHVPTHFRKNYCSWEKYISVSPACLCHFPSNAVMPGEPVHATLVLRAYVALCEQWTIHKEIQSLRCMQTSGTTSPFFVSSFKVVMWCRIATSSKLIFSTLIICLISHRLVEICRIKRIAAWDFHIICAVYL